MTFKRIFAVVAIITVFGGSTLGLGLGAGYYLGARVNQAAENRPDAAGMGFSFADVVPQTYPLEVQVSSITGVVQSTANTVVSISFDMPRVNQFGQRFYHPGSGSGIIFAEDENFVYIATNNHVVDSVAALAVSLDDEIKIDAQYIAGDRQSDLAIISVPRAALEGKDYRIAQFGDSDTLHVGDEVVAIGNAMGEGQTATYGIISATSRQITVDGLTLDVLQTDAAINPGNSGGALVNMRGEVIGINTAKAISFNIEGMGYAIPANEALQILNQLLEDGTTPRPYLGIIHFPIDESLRRWYNFASVGLMVQSVEEGSGAYDAGIQPFDLIVGFNGQTVRTADDLGRALRNSSVGDSVEIQIYRYGVNPMTVTAVLGDANMR